MVEGVHPAGMNEACEIMFETRGYGPLRGFFDATYGEEGAVGRDAFSEYAAKVNAEMAAIIKGPSFTTETADATGSTCLAVFGHAVFLNAIAFQVAVAAGAAEAAQDALLDMDLGETEGSRNVEGTIEHAEGGVTSRVGCPSRTGQHCRGGGAARAAKYIAGVTPRASPSAAAAAVCLTS